MDVEAVVRRVAETDPETCDPAALMALTSTLQRLRCWLDAFDAALADRAAELASTGGCWPDAD